MDEAWFFIAERNMTAANALIDRITTTSKTLADKPKMGRLRPELGNQLRSFPIDNYIILYSEIAHSIEIIRIMHTRRKIGRGDLT